MNRKHFSALAAALKATRAGTRTIEAVAAVCADSNPSFDFKKFREAAGQNQPARLKAA